jgi:two-component system, NtrC family, sensor histidine kinase HydH
VPVIDSAGAVAAWVPRDPWDEPGTPAMLECLLDQLADGVVAAGRDGRVAYWSDSLARLTGVAAAQARGRRVDELLGGLAPVFDGVDPQTRSGSLRFPTGELPLRLTAVRAPGPAGTTLGRVAAVTDLRRAARDRGVREQREALAHLGQMVATAAHQLRNPLGACLGFLGLLEQDLGDSPSSALLLRVREGLLEMDRRIDELLSYARPRELQPRELDFGGLVRAITQAATARFPGGPVIELRATAHLSLRADEAQLRQAIENLVVNAAQAAGPHGRVRVWARGETCPAHGGERGVRLLIRNTGAELRPGELKQLFEPFVTRKPGGTGLGLPLARRVIESHGGAIHALSAGGWTTFVVTLPFDPHGGMEENR